MKMIRTLAVALVLCTEAFAFGGKAPQPSASPSPSPSPCVVGIEPSPKPLPTPEALLVTIGANTGTNVDRKFLHEAIDLLNKTYSSGCLKQKVLAHTFKTLERDPKPALKPNEVQKAWDLFEAGAPYAVDFRWYWSLKGVIGYTYFYKDNVKSGPSETRVWTNTRKLTTSKMYAAHIGHEVTHQGRAGGFGHWTRFDGSFPYVVGDLVADCLKQEMM